MQTQAKKEGDARYKKAHTTTVLLRFFHTTDADILTKLAAVENKNGYIKQLIREDIERNGF